MSLIAIFVKGSESLKSGGIPTTAPLPQPMPMRPDLSKMNQNALLQGGQSRLVIGGSVDSLVWDLLDDGCAQDEVGGSVSGGDSSSSVRADTSSMTSDIDVEDIDAESLRGHDGGDR